MAVQGRRRGMALVLVMTVVLALTIIATPFVLSMILQERSGTMSRYASQADWGADGARNYAVWRLMMGLDPLERRSTMVPMNTYYYDQAQEFDIRLDEPYLAKAKTADPKGSIWGVAVQDEQGKLNVRSAPSGAIGRVKGTVDDRLVSHKNFLTLYSGRDATWVVPQRIRSMGTAQPGMNTGAGVWCDSFHVLGPQSRVRVTKPGLPPLYARVSSNPMISGTPGLMTEPQIPQAYMEGVIEVEARHPVNVNTARREVLVAVFEGLNIVNQPASNIDGGTALRLANAFLDKRLTRLEDFLLLLGQQGLNPQQYQAVALNAVCPSWVGLGGSGTVPFCFKSYDVYTIEAYAAMSNPSGASVAGRGFREVVSVFPPNPVTLFCESQLDFDSMLKTLAVSVQRAQLLGFPYGNRITTYPNMLPSPYPTAQGSRPPAPSATALKNAQQGPNEAYVAQVPSRDFRGESDPTYERDLQGWPAGAPREHFDNDQEGKKLQNAAHTMPWNQVFTTMPAQSQGQGPGVTQPDIAAGGLELWVKFESMGSPTTIFDIRERDYSNRLTLRVENGELIFTACDATIGVQANIIDDGAAEIRQPFAPVPDTWYHFGAYWKGTRYAHLALLVDGFAHPQQRFGHVNPEGTRVITKLATALPPGSTALTLQDSSFLPSGVISPLLIGNEIVLYDPGGGTVVRAARNTVESNHPAGATVSIFGYSSKVRNGQISADFGAFQVSVPYSRIPTGGGRVAYNFGFDPTAVVVGDKQNPTTMQYYVDTTQTDIGVIATPVTDFPDQGYLRIDSEVIFYTGRVQTPLPGAIGSTARFTGCVRGQHGTTAADHNSGAQVRMWAVPVTDTNNYDSPTIIQIGDEWFGPVQRDPVRPTYWISFVNAGQPVNLRRGNGVFASIPGAHAAGDQVIPTFLCREVHPQVNNENLGRGDWVTVTDAQNNKEQQQVNHASPFHAPAGTTPIWPEASWNWPGTWQIAAFRDNVSRAYVADDLHVRVLKFPSGELLGLNWIQTASPSLAVGPLSGTIDELKAFASPKQDLQLAVEMGVGGNTLTLNQGGGLGNWPFGGLLKIGDEYMGYGQYQANQASQITRGWLNSTAEVHDGGDRVFFLYWVPVASLASDVQATDRDIVLRQRLAGRPQPDRTGPGYSKGYVLIDQEVLLFEWNNGDGLTLGMPPKFDGTGGLYRGMFGTAPTTHAASTSLAYGIPWRYWDTYKAREFDNTMSYFQWSTKLEGATFRNVQWTEEIPAGDRNIAVHALVRIDGKAEFYEAPGQTGNAGSHLFEFTGGGAKKTINRAGYQMDAGQFDIRFYWEYRQGSFNALAPWDAHSWKRTPKIKEIRLEVEKPVQTLHHEDR